MKRFITIANQTYVVEGDCVYRYHPMPYRFDIDKISEPFDAMIHAMAITAAITNRWDFSLFPSVEEAAISHAARERECQAWEPAGRYQGD